MEAEIEGLKVDVFGHVRRLLFSCFFSLLAKNQKFASYVLLGSLLPFILDHQDW